MLFSNHVIHALRQIDRSIRVRGLIYTTRLAARVVWQEGLSGVGRRLDALGPVLRAKTVMGESLILTMPHTLHFAQRLQAVLGECGITAQVSDNDRMAKKAKQVFAIAPQNFPAVRPERSVAFQVEQYIATERWTETYLDRLAQYRAVWDFSTENITQLRKRIPFRNIYHVPFWPKAAYSSAERQGILFYGDTTSPRRQRLLKDLCAALPGIKVESNLFGPCMIEKLKQTSIVLNLHAREGALLETARIAEAISHGCVVVSETARDAEPIPGLCLVPEGDTQALINTLRELTNSDQLVQLQAETTAPGPDHFRLGILRALQGMELITPEVFDALATSYTEAVLDSLPPQLCLSLPETPERSSAFNTASYKNFRIWPALKADPGWRGAALSYRRIFRELRDKAIPEALIVEDDIILPKNFDRQLEVVRDAMKRADADLFSGMIVDLHKDTVVLDVERRDGLTLVHLDRAVMMMCNIYRERMIHYLADWDHHNDNVFINTIDRYMERATHLRVITTLPFLAAYRPDAQSTIRSADNRAFDVLLRKSEAELARKVADFEASRELLRERQFPKKQMILQNA